MVNFIAMATLACLNSSCQTQQHDAISPAGLTQRYEPTEDEIQKALQYMQKEMPLYPLVPKDPKIQSEIDAIGQDIQRDIRIEKEKHCLDWVHYIFLEALRARIPNAEISSPEIHLIPFDFAEDGVQYAELSAFINGRTYTTRLKALNGAIVQRLTRKVTPVSALEIAQSITTNMTHDFLQHIRTRIALHLISGDLDEANKIAAQEKIARLIHEDGVWFAAIGQELKDLHIFIECGSSKTNIKILTNGLQNGCIDLHFSPEELAH